MGAARILSSALPAAVRTDATEAADGASGAAHVAGAQGTLDLRCRAVDIKGTRRTVVDTVAQTPPLRMIRAFALADGGALVHLHNGDHVIQEVQDNLGKEVRHLRHVGARAGLHVNLAQSVDFWGGRGCEEK